MTQTIEDLIKDSIEKCPLIKPVQKLNFDIDLLHKIKKNIDDSQKEN